MSEALRILQLSTRDTLGGAARAMTRLHEALQHVGVSSQALVFSAQSGLSGIQGVLTHASSLQRWQIRLARKRNQWALRDTRYHPYDYWSLNHTRNPLAHIVNARNATHVHLHWVGENFVPIQALKQFRPPLVWTFHDSWAMTGGCHLPGACSRYTSGCGHCPQLRRAGANDLSARVWRLKRDQWRDVPMTIITPSRWMADCVRRSPLLAHAALHIIPNALDVERFRAIPRSVARQLLGWPQDMVLVGTGAQDISDPKKGVALLQQAMQTLPADLGVAVLGAREAPMLGRPAYAYAARDELGLIAYYSAIDVFVAPSTTENLPYTVMEAMACGVPCVAFEIGGLSDLIVHGQHGVLAIPFDTEALAEGIRQALANREIWGLAARAHVVQHYAAPLVAQQHRAVYRALN